MLVVLRARRWWLPVSGMMMVSMAQMPRAPVKGFVATAWVVVVDLNGGARAGSVGGGRRPVAFMIFLPSHSKRRSVPTITTPVGAVQTTVTPAGDLADFAVVGDIAAAPSASPADSAVDAVLGTKSTLVSLRTRTRLRSTRRRTASSSSHSWRSLRWRRSRWAR